MTDLQTILTKVLGLALIFAPGGWADETGEDRLTLAGDPVTSCRAAAQILGPLGNPSIDTAGAVHLATSQRQLFVDDVVVASIQNVTRRLHQPNKIGPVIIPDRTWEGGSIQVRTGPSWDPEQNQWMLWYSGGYARSVDGVHWAKPILEFIDYKGSKENNLMLPRTEYVFKDPETGREVLRQIGDGITIDNVFYDASELDPRRRYKGTGYKGPICCVTGGRGMGFYPAVSPDGRNWRVLDTAFVPSGDELHIFQDETKHIYAATVKQPGPYGRSVYLSVSKDFEHWSDPRDCLIFHADQRDQQLGVERVQMHLIDPDLRKPVFNNPEEYQTDIYNLAVFPYAGLYIGMPTVFNHSGNAFSNSDGFSMAELAASRDLIHWIRLGNREKFIPLSHLDGERNYDTAQLLAADRPVIKENEVWFYYTGLKWRDHPDERSEHKISEHPDSGAICLARLRRDGFISLDAGEREGAVLTKALTFEGYRLHVNMFAKNGSIVVEALDASGREVLSGYSAAESVPLTGDRLDADATWTHASVGGLVGRSVRFRFRLHNASLYSFWID